MTANGEHDDPTRQQHWDDVYTRKDDEEVSWYEPEAKLSLELVVRSAPSREAKVIDVGGGVSRLVDGLLARGYHDLTVLDVSAAALARGRARLGARGEGVRWVRADVTTFDPPARYDVWHDRAVLHFLTSADDRGAYARTIERAVAPGGHAVVGTFAPDGPERCSGLAVVRYDAAGIAAVLGPAFELVESLRHEHVTPGGKVQPFTFVRLARAAT